MPTDILGQASRLLLIEESVELKAHTPIPAEGNCEAWLVLENFLDVFYAELEPDGSFGRRLHIARRNAGDIFFALPSVSNARYLLVGTSRIRRVDPIGSSQVDLQRGIEQWVACTTLEPTHTAHRAVVISAGDQVELQRQENIVGASEPVWIIKAPPLRIDGAFEAHPEAENSFVLCGLGWASLSEAGHISAVNTEEAFISATTIPKLLGPHHRLLEWRAKARLDEDEASLERQAAETYIQEETQRHEVFGSLGAILGLSWKAEQTEPDESLDEALKLVAECVGTRSLDTSAFSSLKNGEDLKSKLDHCGLIYRAVRLEQQWWKKEAGPLIGFIGDDKSKHAVALLPYGSGYQLCDPLTGNAVRLTKKNIKNLSSEAFAFYAPFPKGKISLFDAMKFSLEGASNDLLLLFMASVATAVLGALTPYFTSMLISEAIPNSDVGLLIFIALALAGGAVASAIFSMGRGFTMIAMETKADNRVEGAIWDRILRLPAPFFRKFNAGELAMRAAALSAARKALSQASIQALFGILSIPVQLFMMFYFYPSLAGWAIAVTIIGLVLYLWIAVSAVRERREEMLARSRISGVTLQLLQGISKIRVAGMEPRAFVQWAKRFSKQKHHSYKAQRQIALLTTLNATLPNFTLLVVFAVAIGAITDTSGEGIQTSDFIAFISALTIFQGAMMAVVSAVVHSASLKPLADLSKPILEAVPEATEDRTLAPKLRGQVNVQGLNFSYSDEGPQILSDVSIEAEPGQFIALVGPSGSGKSTVFRLLLGFESPQSGSISYDGHLIDEFDLKSVRNQLGVVLQTGKIMPGTILDNVNGANDYGQDAAWEALAMAGMDEDVRDMPMGIFTTLSEGGGTLSGGQRQRLLIARAIVGKPPVLLMDEATSALDNRTQEIVSKSLAKMNSTRIVIAHRLSTIQEADKIYVLEKGVVKEVGDAESLMRQNGIFAQMASRQLA